MYIFTCVNFVGWYPVGTAAVIIAEDIQHARDLLMDKLEKEGLLEHPDQRICDWEIIELDISTSNAHILRNGMY